VSRKRSRRISTTSAAAHGSLWSDEGTVEDGFQLGGVGERGRKNSASRVSFSSGAGSRGRPSNSASGATPTMRPYRHRTSSSASHLPGPSNPTSVPSGGLISPLTTILPDNSQTGLEKVINARLIETFLAISVPHSSTPVGTPGPGSMSRSPSSSTFSPRDRPSASQDTKGVDNNVGRKPRAPPLSPSEKVAAHVRCEASVSPRSSPASKTTNVHAKSASTSTLRPNGKINGTLHSFSPPQKPSPPYEPDVPNYISPIRRPSTNPSFPIDTKSDHNFSEGSDLSGDKIKIEIWGRVGDRWKRDVSFRRNGKEKEVEPPEEADKEWKILDEWFVDLSELVPLSDDVRNCLFFGQQILNLSL
jgi:UV radiation resistance-associated gene protein